MCGGDIPVQLPYTVLTCRVMRTFACGYHTSPAYLTYSSHVATIQLPCSTLQIPHGIHMGQKDRNALSTLHANTMYGSHMGIIMNHTGVVW